MMDGGPPPPLENVAGQVAVYLCGVAYVLGNFRKAGRESQALQGWRTVGIGVGGAGGLACVAALMRCCYQNRAACTVPRLDLAVRPPAGLRVPRLALPLAASVSVAGLGVAAGLVKDPALVDATWGAAVALGAVAAAALGGARAAAACLGLALLVAATLRAADPETGAVTRAYAPELHAGLFGPGWHLLVAGWLGWLSACALAYRGTAAQLRLLALFFAANALLWRVCTETAVPGDFRSAWETQLWAGGKGALPCLLGYFLPAAAAALAPPLLCGGGMLRGASKGAQDVLLRTAVTAALLWTAVGFACEVGSESAWGREQYAYAHEIAKDSWLEGCPPDAPKPRCVTGRQNFYGFSSALAVVCVAAQFVPAPDDPTVPAPWWRTRSSQTADVTGRSVDAAALVTALATCLHALVHASYLLCGVVGGSAMCCLGSWVLAAATGALGAR